MSTASRKHNPAFLTDEQLVALFCVRTQEYEALIDVLRESAGNSSQHQIVIGPRGSGKTSLLLRVAAEMRRNDELSLGFFPVVFAEESYEVATVGHFWLECLERLSEQAPSPKEAESLQLTYEELRTTGDIGTMGDRCLGALLDFADRQKKKLVVIVENLQMMFSDIEDPDAGWRLRKTLQTEPRIILFSSATSRFDEIDNPKQAMYDLFRIRTLRPLTTGECATLWETISGRCPSPETIRSLQILTGGNPRLLVIVANFGADLSFKSLMDNLLDLVDDHTEYFKGHLESLPAQERRVYLALARLWKPASAREVAERTLLETNKCSAQLKRLILRGAVRTAGGSARRKYYYLTERLYNIYYLLRRNRKSEPLVEALVRFMEAFYSPAELLDIGARIVREEISVIHDPDSLPRIALTHLMESPALADRQEALLALMPEDLVNTLKSTAEKSRRTATKTAAVKTHKSKHSERKETAADLMLAANDHFKQHQFEDAIAGFDQIIRRYGKSKKKSNRQLVALSRAMNGLAHFMTDRKHEALEILNNLLHRYGKGDDSTVNVPIALALCSKGSTLQTMDQQREALDAFDEAVQRLEGEKSEGVSELQIIAISNRAELLEELDRIDDAIAAYEDLDRRYESSNKPDAMESTARALFRKAVLLANQERYEEVIGTCDEIVRRYGDESSPVLVETSAKALTCKAHALILCNQLQDAMEICDEVLRRFENSERPSVSWSIATVLMQKGILAIEKENFDEALVAFEAVETRLIDRTESFQLETVANTSIIKSFVLFKLDRNEEAIETCNEIAHRFEESENPILLQAVARSLVHKGFLMMHLNQRQEALDSLEDVIVRFEESEQPAITQQVQEALLQAADIQMESGDFEAAAKSASKAIDQDLVDSAVNRSRGHLLRARASFALGDHKNSEHDVNVVLELLPQLDALDKTTVDTLVSFAVHLGSDRMLELIQESAAASLLLPLTTALQRDLGIESRVAIEVEEVADDIQRKLATLRDSSESTVDTKQAWSCSAFVDG